jgi:hypothetical protein
MGKTATNISIILGLLTIAFAGYYIYLQRDNMALNIGSEDKLTENVLNSAAVFINYRQTLSDIDLDLSLFEDERFTTLQSYATPIQERPIGRVNPFANPEPIEVD